MVQSTFGIYISSGSSLSNDAGGYEGLLTKTSKGSSVLRLREEGQPRRRQNLNFLLIFVRDPEFAEAYLKEVLSDGDMAEVHQARPWVEEARSRRQDAIMA